jgi:ABC-2 type transport system permease protein
MLRLLRIEWMKIKNYRTFWILLIITIVSIPAFNYMFYDLMDNSFPKFKGKSIFGSPFAFPDVWQTVSWNSSLLLVIPAILIITLTSNEFTYKTHRQNVIDGWSRSQFINVKIFEVFLLSLLTTLIVFITCMAFGYLGNKVTPGAAVFHDVRYVFFYFVEMLSYSMIAFLLAMFIKRAGLAMGMFFIYMIVEQVVVGILRHKYGVKGVDYLPQEVTDMLIPQAYLQKIRLAGTDQVTSWENHIPIYLTIAGIYLLLYCVVTSWRFRKSDL